MINVLQITTLPITARLFVVPIASALADLGCQVEFAYGGPEQVDLSPFTSHHLKLSRRPYDPDNIRGLGQLLRLLRTRRYDVVHVHTPVAGLVGRLAARLAGVPLILYTLHGSFWDTLPRWRATLFDRLERLAALWTSHVFVLNEADRRDMIHRCGLQPQHITQLPVGGAGVNLTRFNPARFSPESIADQRRALGLPLTGPVIGYVGRIDRDKGIADLLQAFGQVQNRFPQARLLLVGDRLTGDRDASLDALLAALGSAAICSGFRDDVPAMLACMDIVVSPSYRDGFGMVLAEAAAMGKPVVATRTRGAYSAVEHQQNGLLVPLGNIDALAGAIATLLAQPDLARQMAETGRQLAEERFDEQLVFQWIKAEYARLLQEKGLPVPIDSLSLEPTV